MTLKAAVDHPTNTALAAVWLGLGLHDPTRTSAEQESQLLQQLGRLDARMVVVFRDEKPILRFLSTVFLPAEGIASLGFFALAPDCDDSSLQEGFQLALPHLRSPAIKKFVGPMNGNTWFTYRVRVDQHPLHFEWEPKVQPRLQTLLEAAGFSAWAHYHSLATRGLQDLKQHLKKDWQSVTDRGLTIRLLKPTELPQALPDLHRLSQLGFAANPLFAPLDFETFARSYVGGKSEMENFIAMAFDASGKALAFFLVFLEASEGHDAAKTMVLKTAATDPDFRRQGLSNALLYAICEAIHTPLTDTYISALVFQGWNSESYARHGTIVWEHQYILLARDEA